MDDATTPSPASPEVQQALVQRGVNILVSREAARRLGFASPQQAIGKQIKTSIVDSDYGLVPSTIVGVVDRSEEHTYELQSLMRISYAVFCLKKKQTT